MPLWEDAVAMGDIIVMGYICYSMAEDKKNEAINGLQLLRKEVVPGMEKEVFLVSSLPLRMLGC